MIRWRRGADMGEAGMDLIRWWYVPAGALAASAYENVDHAPGESPFQWAVEVNGDPAYELRAGDARTLKEAKTLALARTRELLKQSLARLR